MSLFVTLSSRLVSKSSLLLFNTLDKINSESKIDVEIKFFFNFFVPILINFDASII